MATRHGQVTVLTDTAVGNRLDWIRAIDYPEWMAQGLCAQQIELSPDSWFPLGGPGPNPTNRVNRTPAAQEAKRVCGECPVRVQCLEYAFEADERHGIWGGLDQYERRELKDRRSA